MQNTSGWSKWECPSGQGMTRRLDYLLMVYPYIALPLHVAALTLHILTLTLSLKP
jgi:hypothetical protein